MNNDLTIAEKIIANFIGSWYSDKPYEISDFLLDMHGGEIIHFNEKEKLNTWVFPDGSLIDICY